VPRKAREGPPRVRDDEDAPEERVTLPKSNDNEEELPKKVASQKVMNNEDDQEPQKKAMCQKAKDGRTIRITEKGDT
jgi:hypothetical protein